MMLHTPVPMNIHMSFRCILRYSLLKSASIITANTVVVTQRASTTCSESSPASLRARENSPMTPHSMPAVTTIRTDRVRLSAMLS